MVGYDDETWLIHTILVGSRAWRVSHSDDIHAWEVVAEGEENDIYHTFPDAMALLWNDLDAVATVHVDDPRASAVLLFNMNLYDDCGRYIHKLLRIRLNKKKKELKLLKKKVRGKHRVHQ